MAMQISKYAPLAAGLCVLLSGCATQQAVKDSEDATEFALARIELQQQAAKAEMRDLHNLLDKRLSGQDAARNALAQKLDALEARMTAVQTALDPLRAEMTGQAAQADKQAAGITRQVAEVAQREAGLAARLDRLEQQSKALEGQDRELKDLLAREHLRIHGRVEHAVTLTEDSVLYPINAPELPPGDMERLAGLVAHLKTLEGEYHLDIQGHTDNLRGEDFDYNLGKARAEVVKRILHEKFSIALSRMSAISYGGSAPVAAGSQHNRRILIRVLVPAEKTAP